MLSWDDYNEDELPGGLNKGLAASQAMTEPQEQPTPAIEIPRIRSWGVEPFLGSNEFYHSDYAALVSDFIDRHSSDQSALRNSSKFTARP